MFLENQVNPKRGTCIDKYLFYCFMTFNGLASSFNADHKPKTMSY